MCGINGIYGLSEERNPSSIVKKMNTSIAHRGPDDEGVFADQKIALGHRRLSIIDLSKDGHQPMTSCDNNFIIVYNGELYNYQDLKKQLKEYPFKTNTDTEVILAAYQKWGVDCLNHFNGMFAFAIWDKTKQQLFIARDKLGKKPLYYTIRNEILVFSSEIRALLTTGLVDRKVNKNALIDYLRYQTVHAPQTILENVFMLMPSHYMLCNESGTRVEPYWNIATPSHSNIGGDYDKICRDINGLLTQAVERRLMADVPFGAFLSGGIDSSAIVGLMSKISTQKVKTFSIVFDDKKFTEAAYSRLVAKRFNTEHHEINLKASDFLMELPAALKAMDHPSGDGPNTYTVSKATKNAGITMALSGLGGDELFAGYEIFTRTLKLQKYHAISLIPLSMRKMIGKGIGMVKQGTAADKLSELLGNETIDFTSSYYLSRQVLSDIQIKKLLNYPLDNKNQVDEIVKEHTALWNEQTHLLSKVSIAEILTYMQNVLLRDTDQMSMAHALEVRAPFLDYKLVEYVLSVPDKYKNPITPKKLLVDALGDLLPPEIVNRPKMGFTFPWKFWMQNDLKAFCDQRINSLSQREFMNEKDVLSLWNSFLHGHPSVTWSRVWPMVVLEEWLTQNNVEN